jgi:hypothetical protein
MTPLDYGRSFLIGKAAVNEVRFWVESRTRIIDSRTGRSDDYLQAGSCKSEMTFAARDLFQQDNYDFLPVFGPEHGLIFRRKAALNPMYRQTLPAAGMWEGQEYHLVEAARIRELATNQAIREATYAFLPLVAQTEIRDEATGLRAIIEYPVKTMNTHRARDMYQVDTGPIAFPDLGRRYEPMVDCISLAFVAFNAPGFADFVLEAPTGVGKEQVHHYSRLVSLPATNRLYAVEA